LWFMKHFSRFL